MNNNQVFFDFLSMLRSKYLDRDREKGYTFHSVILTGVHDVRNMKQKLIRDGSYILSGDEVMYSTVNNSNTLQSENPYMIDFQTAKYSIANCRIHSYNSPWNIAAKFNIDMSFNPVEITSMIHEYEADHNTGMDISEISHEIYKYTNGYPFLVSNICKIIDEELDKNWTLNGVQESLKIILAEHNTLFDDLFKNLENNDNLYNLVYDVLINGWQIPFTIDSPTINIGAMYGIISGGVNGVSIANKIFEIRICNYFIAKDMENNSKRKMTGVLTTDVVNNGRFDMVLALKKFGKHYEELFAESDVKFLEKHGRLLFLSYLKPLINGQGFYHIESQFTDLRRMDVVVDYGRDQFIIE